MPTTSASLIIFLAFLLPGLAFFLQRRRSPVQLKLSALAETVSFFAVSMVTNVFAALLFALYRVLFSNHAPDVRKLVLDGRAYIAPRIGYLLGWGAIVLAVSVGLAVLLGRWSTSAKGFSRILPIQVDVSSWYRLFHDEAPEGNLVYVGCEMRDGIYISGYVDWYNTDRDDIPDRDLVLADPKIRVPDQQEPQESGFSRLVVSARDVVRLHVSYIEKETEKGT